jgi:hypothetical protein
MQQEKSISEKIIDVFTDGPGTVDDLVIELGMGSRKITGTLCFLMKTGKITRRPFYLAPEIKKPGRDRVFLYSLRSYEQKAA